MTARRPLRNELGFRRIADPEVVNFVAAGTVTPAMRAYARKKKRLMRGRRA